MRLLALLLALALSAEGQAVLSLSSADAHAGGSVTLTLTLTSGAVKSAGVQWVLGYSPSDFSSMTAVAGSAATAAAKQLTCNGATGQLICMVSGINNGTIPDGPVAVVTLTLGTGGNLSRPVSVAGTMASTPGAQLVASSGTGGVVTASPNNQCPCSLWNSSSVPTILNATDNNPIEVGLKFRSTVAGSVAGVRFYKGTKNTGTHVGHLWSRTGTLLGSVTFLNETASGWQQAKFAVPIAIAANTTYVVSYSSAGYYSDNVSFFTSSGVTSGPLQALKNGTDGVNGVYVYGKGKFPTGAWNASNYWVDVVFQ